MSMVLIVSFKMRMVVIFVGTFGSVSHFNIDDTLVPIFQSLVFVFRHSRTLNHDTKWYVVISTKCFSIEVNMKTITGSTSLS